MTKFLSILAAIESAASVAAQLDPSIATDVELGQTIVGFIANLIPHAQSSAPSAPAQAVTPATTPVAGPVAVNIAQLGVAGTSSFR